MSNVLRANDINEWFPPTHQQLHIETIIGQFGLTRRQATCFVRLWGYAYAQQSDKSPPLKLLSRHVESFCCSHSEAASLFYCDHPRGSDRAAGMMIDQLVGKHLVRREPFDGGPTRLGLKIPHSFLPKATSAPDSQLYTNAFNGRQDTSFVAALLEKSYGWVSQRSETTSFKIAKVLRRWATQYPDGLRVIRKVVDDEPVGFTALFPTHPDSEEKFHLPPSSSLYLSTMDSDDPIKMASPGDAECYAVFIRSWQVKPTYWDYPTVCQFMQDAQTTLRRMQQSFPNLCDLYSIAIHPALESLALALGFKPMKADPNSSLHWIYMPLDQFLALDIDEVLVEYDFNRSSFV